MGDPKALTTVARLQQELKNPSADTTECTAIILEVSYDIASRCNREFYYAGTHTEEIAGYATTRLQVNDHCPIDLSQPVSVLFNGLLFDPSAYTVSNPDLGFIYNRTGWWWTAPSINNVQQDPFAGNENQIFAVTYSGGWVTPQQFADTPSTPRTLPYDIEAAALAWCVQRFRMQGKNPFLKSERLMTYSYANHDHPTDLGLVGIPMVDSVIARYKRGGCST